MAGGSVNKLEDKLSSLNNRENGYIKKQIAERVTPECLLFYLYHQFAGERDSKKEKSEKEMVKMTSKFFKRHNPRGETLKEHSIKPRISTPRHWVLN